MTPLDPRHGTNAGYVAGCRADCCADPRRLSDKRNRLLRHRGYASTFTPEQVDELLAPWEVMGVSRTALRDAAGLKTSHLAAGEPVSRITYYSLSAITEDRLPMTRRVWADLTKTRLYSLMAAGHRFRDTPAASHGLWRSRDRISIGLAREVRDHYADVAHTPGTSTYTANRARNNGHPHPDQWEDPGTLAWPLGWTCELAIIDEVIVERLLAGVHTPTSTRLEREEAMRRHMAAGHPEWQLSKWHQWPSKRYLPPEIKEAG